MVRASVEHLGMNVGVCPTGKTLKELGDQLRFQVADMPLVYLCLDYTGGASAEINGNQAEGLIHGHDEVTGAQNSPLTAQGLGEGLSQGNAHIFDRVMLVDVQVAGRVQPQVKCAVAGEQLQHVIEEANACGYVVAPL